MGQQIRCYNKDLCRSYCSCMDGFYDYLPVSGSTWKLWHAWWSVVVMRIVFSEIAKMKHCECSGANCKTMDRMRIPNCNQSGHGHLHNDIFLIRICSGILFYQYSKGTLFSYENLQNQTNSVFNFCITSKKPECAIHRQNSGSSLELSRQILHHDACPLGKIQFLSI